jgi:hypothetical protein
MIEKIYKAIRFPMDIIDWINQRRKSSKRTFSGEVIYQLYKIMGKAK